MRQTTGWTFFVVGFTTSPEVIVRLISGIYIFPSVEWPAAVQCPECARNFHQGALITLGRTIPQYGDSIVPGTNPGTPRYYTPIYIHCAPIVATRHHSTHTSYFVLLVLWYICKHHCLICSNKSVMCFSGVFCCCHLAQYR